MFPMSKSAPNLLLLSSETGTITSDGAGKALREEERLRVLILALAIWDIAARFVRCVASLLNAATSVVLSNLYVQQLQERLQDTSHAAVKIAAQQEVCRKRCMALRAPSQTLLLSRQASQLTVRQAMHSRSAAASCLTSHCISLKLAACRSLWTGTFCVIAQMSKNMACQGSYHGPSRASE